MTWDTWLNQRGEPWEHDPGPPRNRRWARLFAETPNYRGLGRAVIGRESFRWHFGPMFYRGRLRDGDVKVLIVGQEGAQDESLAHRAFVGGTGARMQHVVNHLGITRSYLFLNTFCYPIFGQYGEHLRWLAQDPASPIAAHRHEIFDYVVARNDLQLVIAVGTAAKESIASWLAVHGVTADPRDLTTADPSSISPRLRTVGVLHPGGAAAGGTGIIEADFRRALAAVDRWRADDPGWLLPDAGAAAGTADGYRYRSAPLPFRDFPFGTTWRLGRGGTSSNRKDSQRSIQLFSADGRYNGRGDDPTYSGGATGSPDGYEDETGDLPFEPPKASYLEFDPGPDPTMARLLSPGWPTMAGALGHPSFGYGPIYRGRLDDVTMLVLADQAGNDDLFTGRALTGEAGQHLQAWMRAVGIDRRYLILRVPPFDVTGATSRQRERWVDDNTTTAAYRAILERVRSLSPRGQVIVTVGSMAARLAASLALSPAVTLPAYDGGRTGEAWHDALDRLSSRRFRKDVRRPTFQYTGRRDQIPRVDLPYGTLRWQGTSGDRAVQARVDGRRSGDYYKLFVPAWVFDLPPEPLSESEQRAVSDA